MPGEWTGRIGPTMFWRGSLPCGRLFGIEIRLHWFFLLWAVFDLGRAGFLPEVSLGWTARALGLLFLAVLLHEFGHCYASRRLGGSADRVLLWPLGGLAEVSEPRGPREQAWVTAGGPAVNLAFVLAILPYVLTTGQESSFLLRFGPPGSDPDILASFWAVNFDLLVFNLLPATPLDGGKLLHSLVWARRDRPAATSKLVLSSRFVAIALALVWLFGGAHGGVLLGVALLIWISAEFARRQAGETEQDERWLDLPGELGEGGGSSGWSERRARAEERRREDERRDRAMEVARVDDLLEKVHREGMEALSRSERRFLEKASRRIRERRSGE